MKANTQLFRACCPYSWYGNHKSDIIIGKSKLTLRLLLVRHRLVNDGEESPDSAGQCTG